MVWTTSSLHRLAGALMLLLVVGLVLGFIFSETPDSARSEIADDLRDVDDDAELYLFGQSVQIVIGLLVPLLGAALYTLLRARDRFLALVGFSGFFGLGILFIASAASYVVVERLAHDLVEGGAGGAGEAEILELARITVQVGDGLFFTALLLFGLGLIGFGLTMALAPARAVLAEGPRTTAIGVVSPPPWMGWIATVAGVLYILGFLAVFSEWLFLTIAIGFLLTLIWYLAAGIWLLFIAPAVVQDVREAAAEG